MHPLKVSGSMHAPPTPFGFKDKPVYLGVTVGCVFLVITVLHQPTDTTQQTQCTGSTFSTATCFGCSHQPSSGWHRFTQRIKISEDSPKKQRCKVVIVTTIIPYKMSNYIKNVSATSRYNPMYRIKYNTEM